MDYLKSVVPSQLITERGSNLVVINPGSANARIGFAQQQVPFNIPHCIARRVKVQGHCQKGTVKDEMLNCEATPVQYLEHEKAYDIIASLLKIPFLDEAAADNPFPPKIGRADGYTSHQSRNDATFTWMNVMERSSISPLSTERLERVGAANDSVVSASTHEMEPSFDF